MPDISTPNIEDLVAAAHHASQHAYAPYSEFRTGAAVLTESTATHTGAIVENLIFGLAMCAERVAMFKAVAAGARRFSALAVVAPPTGGQPTFPCGPCLQVAVEFGGPEMLVISSDPSVSSYETSALGELAPGLPRRSGPTG